MAIDPEQLKPGQVVHSYYKHAYAILIIMDDHETIKLKRADEFTKHKLLRVILIDPKNNTRYVGKIISRYADTFDDERTCYATEEEAKAIKVLYGDKTK